MFSLLFLRPGKHREAVEGISGLQGLHWIHRSCEYHLFLVSALRQGRYRFLTLPSTMVRAGGCKEDGQRSEEPLHSMMLELEFPED